MAWWKRVCDMHNKSRVRARICIIYKSLGQLEFYSFTWIHKVRFPESGVSSSLKKRNNVISSVASSKWKVHIALSTLGAHYDQVDHSISVVWTDKPSRKEESDLMCHLWYVQMKADDLVSCWFKKISEPIQQSSSFLNEPFWSSCQFNSAREKRLPFQCPPLLFLYSNTW